VILAVCGGKGGVGKSTLAFNLAAEVGAVVVDADLTMADLPACGGGPDLHDVLAGRAAPVEAVRSVGPVSVLPCGRSLAGARATDPVKLADAVERVGASYGDAVVDCPAGLGADAALPLYAADACLPVTTPDRPAVTDALRTRELARTFDAGVVRAVVNRVRGEPSLSAVEEAFGAPAVAVPECRDLAAAWENGRPVTAWAPGSAAAERVAALAAAVQSDRSA
jgi:septum site-determining protein MinD